MTTCRYALGDSLILLCFVGATTRVLKRNLTEKRQDRVSTLEQGMAGSHLVQEHANYCYLKADAIAYLPQSIAN